MARLDFLAADFGASNGRVMLGEFDGKKLGITEIHRFENRPVTVLGRTYWDILRLFHELNCGLRQYAGAYGGELRSIGIDTWGSDFALLNSDGHLLENPNHYRDARLEGIVEKTAGIINEREIFKLTGNAASKYNTVYRLLSMCDHQPDTIKSAAMLLMIPDLLVYFLTGEKATEYTNATTTQLMDADRKGWSHKLMKLLNIPSDILPEIRMPGSHSAPMLPYVCKDVGLDAVEIVTTAQHDTAAAVAAIPGLDADSVFLSSGTWSLIGVETDRTYMNDIVYNSGYTNEGGVDSKNLLLRNTVGMWPIQECVREWSQKGEECSYGALIASARKYKPFASFFDTDRPEFSMPGNLPGKIRGFCLKTEQPVPETNAEMFLRIMENLAFKYRWCVLQLEAILGRKLAKVHIVGGGSQNDMLNQFTANATNMPVVCETTEATAIGNMLVQALAVGELASLGDVRQVVAASFQSRNYEPQNTELWNEAYETYLERLKLEENG